MDQIPHHYVLPWITENRHTSMEQYKSIGTFATFKSGDILSLQGKVEKEVVYLTKGCVKVSSITEEGNEKIFWYDTAPSLVGEVSLFDAQFSNASIIACEPCEGYLFSEQQFRQLLAQDTALHFEVTKGMAMKIRILISQVHEIAYGRPMKQISRLIYFYAKENGTMTDDTMSINLNITQSEISALVAIHRTTVVKVLSELKSKQILSFNPKSHIIIYDMEKLKDIAF